MNHSPLPLLAALSVCASQVPGTLDASGTGVLEEIVTTATKKSEAEVAQDVPAAITVLNRDRLASQHVTDLEDLSYSLPNVALDGIGTGKGIANFSIRGLGVAGSIPSIDPTVGVFIDGVYLGVNYGVIVDMLDLEAVEVLRGPQGLLFGRNVTGGAVLYRSRRPGGRPGASGALRLETGPDWRFAGSAEGAFADGDLGARISAAYRNDSGWFENSAPGGGRVGSEATWVLRPILTWTAPERLDFTLIYEQGDSDGDGAATQNRRRFSGFGLAIDEPGYSRIDWRHVILEANRRLAPGGGLITNVLGWREVRHESLVDVDSTADPVFHLYGVTDQEQLSNELRYSGWIRGWWETTVGVYLFAQRIRYRERRILRSVAGVPFGGDQDHRTGGVFFNNHLRVADEWFLTLGARYTIEEKDVDVATAGSGSCVLGTSHCEFDFRDGGNWRNVTPLIGVQRWLGAGTHLYGHFTRGFRSGGYNLRNTSPEAAPGPFDEEEQDSLEIGLKSEFLDGRMRLNIAAFRNAVYGMQRQVTRADAAGGAVQITANTADATIRGLEAEWVAAPGDGLTISAFLGYAHGRYDEVRYDLNGDGTTVGDEQLDLPRLAKWTYGAEARITRNVGERGRVSVRISFAHRDDSEISDNNTGVLDGGDLVDASIRFAPSETLAFTLYGKNLLGEVLRRSDFDLSGLVDSTYSPLKEGRVLGLEVRVGP